METPVMDSVAAFLSNTQSSDGLPASDKVSAPIRPSRTKIVFVYSDEDENEPTKTAQPSSTKSTIGVRTVDCSAEAVPISADALAELEEDASRLHVTANDDQSGDVDENVEFREDLVGGAAVLSIQDTTLLDAIQQERLGSHVHALTVAAPSIRDGAVAAANEEELRPRRHHLRLDELRVAASEPGYKRFRADENDEAEVEEAVASRLKPVISEDGAVRAVETIVGGYRLTVDEDELLEDPTLAKSGPREDLEGADETVEADYGDLTAAGQADFDFDDDDDEEGEEEEELDEAIIIAVAVQLLQCCEGEDLDPSMSREAARFAAVARPLLARLREYEAIHDSDIRIISDEEDVGACEEEETVSGPRVAVPPPTAPSAPTVTSAESGEASSPLSEAAPPPHAEETDEVTAAVVATAVEEKEDDKGPLSPAEFVNRIEYHIRRFQRIFRNVYRPRDEPIFIDGVRMDL